MSVTPTRTHPLTGEPIRPLGRRRDGRLIWPIMGASDDPPPADGGNDDSQDGGDPAGDGGKASPAAGGNDHPWADPEAAKSEIERLRRENTAARTGAKAKAAEDAKSELAQEIGKALGIVKGDKAPTVAELTAELTEQKTATETAVAAHRETQAELVVWRNAKALGVDAAAVTDSRGFVAAIKDLDPASNSFAEDVKKAAQAAAETNPKLKATPEAGKSGSDLAGGTGENAITQEQFNAMNGEQRNRLFQTNPDLYRTLSGR
ncbi:MAG: hypothetical protein QM621_15020 [Aeromicrobium sp.]|uniref:hypothetical protein n=1 Tax=Aeromicrobium sp. TaxID=1871063 RepID=UPI0039E2CD03